MAAFLSLLFPGLGQAYLRRRGDAIRFALPIVIAIVLSAIALIAAGGLVRLGARLFNPNLSLGLAVALVILGVWWVLAIVHAWVHGRHSSVASRAFVAVFVLMIGGANAWGANQAWQLHNASIRIETGDPTINNPVEVTPTPSLPGTPDPNATPSPEPTRPPDYVDPSDEPSDEPSPSIAPGPSPSIDIATIDAHADDWLNVLLTGTDKGLPGHVGGRTDSIEVVSVNSNTGDVYIFSFPRDLQNFPIYNGGTYNSKINTFAQITKLYPDEFPEPGMPSLAYEIGFLLGIPIDYYASVNTDGFMEIVRQVGGITVCNHHDIADNTLQFYLSAGVHHLSPDDALRYVRSRHGEPGADFARAKRQQQVLTALRIEMLKPGNLIRIGDIAGALADLINTNFPVDQLDQLIDLASRVQDQPTGNWVFKNPGWATLYTEAMTGGRPVLTPRLDRIGQLSVSIFGDKSLYWGQVPVPSPGDLPGSDASPTPAPDSSASPDPCAGQP